MATDTTVSRRPHFTPAAAASRKSTPADATSPRTLQADLTTRLFTGVRHKPTTPHQVRVPTGSSASSQQPPPQQQQQLLQLSQLLQQQQQQQQQQQHEEDANDNKSVANGSTGFDFENDRSDPDRSDTASTRPPEDWLPLSQSILMQEHESLPPASSSSSSPTQPAATAPPNEPHVSDEDEDEEDDDDEHLFENVLFGPHNPSHDADVADADAGAAAQGNDLVYVRPEHGVSAARPVFKRLTRTHKQLDELQSMVLKSGAMSYSYKTRGLEKTRKEAEYDMFTTCVPHEDPLRDQQFVTRELPVRSVAEQYQAVIDATQEHCHPTFALILGRFLGLLMDHMQRSHTTTRLTWGVLYNNPSHRSHLLQALVALHGNQAAQQGQAWLRNSVLMLNETNLWIALNHFKQYM